MVLACETLPVLSTAFLAYFMLLMISLLKSAGLIYVLPGENAVPAVLKPPYLLTLLTSDNQYSLSHPFSLQLSSVVSGVTYSFPATLLLEKAMHLAKMHFDLKSTIITGIPMKVRVTITIAAHLQVGVTSHV